MGQVFASDQAAFLAGYLAASLTNTGMVGIFGGMQIPPLTAYMDVTTFLTITSALDGAFAGGVITGNLENGGVGLATPADS